MTTQINPARMSSDLQAELNRGLNEVWLREKKLQKITQTAMAEALGISQPSFSEYLNGKISISVKFVIKVCNILKIDPQEVYPDILKVLPNRIDQVVRHKVSDVESDINETISSDFSTGWVVIKCDESISWEHSSGDTVTIPRGSYIVTIEDNYENRAIYFHEGSNYAVHLEENSKWIIVNQADMEKLEAEAKNRIIKSNLVIAFRF